MAVKLQTVRDLFSPTQGTFKMSFVNSVLVCSFKDNNFKTLSLVTASHRKKSTGKSICFVGKSSIIPHFH